MKVLLSTGDAYEFPKEVKCEIKGRAVRIKGPRGTLSREFKHLAVDMFLTTEEGKLKLHVECHFGKRKRLASIRTVITHIENMVLGVTKGFEYKLRLVYQHFPININIAKTKEGGDQVEVRNFLGEKRVRVIKMKEGCKCVRSEAVKDELIVTGNDKELVSKSCALISQSCLVRGLDIRKFLDGIYISERGLLTKN